MMAKIDQQIEAVKAEMVGKPFTIKNAKGKEVDVRHWFWKSDGHVYSNLIYGNNILNLGKNSQLIANNFKQLITFYEQIRKAVEAGELDAAITKAAARAVKAKD